MGYVNIRYDIEGAKNQEEIKWVEENAINIYHEVAKNSSEYFSVFNKIICGIFRIKGTTELYDKLAHEYLTRIYRRIGKKYSNNKRIIVLDGLEALSFEGDPIKDDISIGTIHCRIEDL